MNKYIYVINSYIVVLMYMFLYLFGVLFQSGRRPFHQRGEKLRYYQTTDINKMKIRLTGNIKLISNK